MKNQYFVADSNGFTRNQISNIKKNNYYVFRALNQIFGTVKEGKAQIGGAFRPALLTGELQKSDELTGVNTNNLAQKLKYLTIALSDKNHPENIEKFKKSYLYNNVLQPLACGYVVDPDQKWLNYKHTNDFDLTFKKANTLEAALICQRDDLTAPIGIDFSRIIDSFVKTDKNGNYYLEDSYTIEEEVSMNEAVKNQLKAMKSNEKFRDNYINPKLGEFGSNNDFEDEL